MNDFWQVLLLSLLPGFGNFVGGLFAEIWQSSPRRLNWALHAASGILIAIVSVELMPNALGTLPGWWVAAAFGAGGILYILLQAFVNRLQGAENQSRSRTGMWMIYIAVAIDLSSDGLVIGASSAVSLGLALVLAAGQILADVPEGFASVANFRANDIPRGRRFLLSASFILFCSGSAVVSFFLLRNTVETVQLAALVFVAGMLTLAAVEDILDEAHESREDTKSSALAFLAGFVLFTLVSVGLESIIHAGGN
jgi:ZIP family zinc transporter